jgi:AcrR family transcriptional regulator
MATAEREISKVARKREAARRRLVDAAMELIAAKGVEGLRLRELAERAEIGFGSFYNHFSSKEELVEAVVADYVGAATDEIMQRALAYEDPAVTAAVAQRSFIHLIEQNRELAWLIVRLDRGEAILEIASLPYLGGVLESGVESGRFSGVDVPVTVSSIVGATISVMRGILEGRLAADADVAAARILLRACGIADPEASEIAATPLD